MPTLFIIGPYRFFFYANEGQEPPHIHVAAAEKKVKFWLDPIRMATSYAFRSHEIREVEDLVREHEQMILEKWNAFFANRS